MDQWHVVWTRPAIEFEVVERVRREGFAAVCPACREWRIIGGARRDWRGRERRERVTLAAFPRYILLSPGRLSPPWQEAELIDGVTRIIRMMGDAEKAAVLPELVAHWLLGPNGDGVIQDIDLTIEKIYQFKLGGSVRITDKNSAFANHVGPVVGQHGRRVKVLLSVLGGAREVELRENQIEELRQ